MRRDRPIRQRVDERVLVYEGSAHTANMGARDRLVIGRPRVP
jgi:hypothetical protein